MKVVLKKMWTIPILASSNIQIKLIFSLELWTIFWKHLPFFQTVTSMSQLDLAKPAYAFHSKDDTAGETDINFDIEKAGLFIPSIILNYQFYTQLKTQLDKEPMRQFCTSTSITTHSISTGDKSTVFRSIC